MECAFLKIGSDDPCHKKPVKNSQYCVIHKGLMYFEKLWSSVKLFFR